MSKQETGESVVQDVDSCVTANYEENPIYNRLGIRIMPDGSGIINQPNCNPS